jgi:hypothetical protein
MKIASFGLRGAFGRYVDITRLGAATRRGKVGCGDDSGELSTPPRVA